MLAGIDLDRYKFSSVHEPCPADLSADELKKRDWLISSTDEAKRCEGVKAIQRTIDLAHRLGAPVIVIHAGQAHADMQPEKGASRADRLRQTRYGCISPISSKR